MTVAGLAPALVYYMYKRLWRNHGTAEAGISRWSTPVASSAFQPSVDANLRTSDGEPTYAVFGFLPDRVDNTANAWPEYAAVSFDVGRTFRHEEYVDYKAGRAETPDDFAPLGA